MLLKSCYLYLRIKSCITLAKNIRHLYFLYLEFFYLYCFLLVIIIIHKFKEFLK